MGAGSTPGQDAARRPGGGTYRVQAALARPPKPAGTPAWRRPPRGNAYYASQHSSPRMMLAILLGALAVTLIVLLHFAFGDPEPTTDALRPAEPTGTYVTDP
jgi:hypothetical protein